MNIKELIHKAPEVTEEKLLELIKDSYKYIIDKYLERRIQSLNPDCDSISKAILSEWDKIQVKGSYLTRGERDKICIVVSRCLVKLVKISENDN